MKSWRFAAVSPTPTASRRCWLPLLLTAIAHRRGVEGRYENSPTGWGRSPTPTMRWAALGRLIAPLLLQGSASPDARILLALPVDIHRVD